MNNNPEWAKFVVQAASFQNQLRNLATTLALKVQREGRKVLPTPAFLSADIYTMIRQAHHTYDLFFFLNADERRQEDVHWKMPYSVAVFPLVRCMIDCLDSITVLLDQPGANGYQYRLSGFKKALRALEADETRYAGDPEWDKSNATFRNQLDLMIRAHGFTMQEVNNAVVWPTLTGYLRESGGKAAPSPHQEFLTKLTLGFWDEYSGIAHVTFQGLLSTGSVYMREEFPHDARQNVDTMGERMIFKTIGRVAGILLCILTEVQTYFQFDGARINQRLHEVWDALRPLPEIKELYDGRYAQLMELKNITAQ
jgi:hypothetical protein